MRKQTIEFSCVPSLAGVAPAPIPARLDIPEWYKKLPTYPSTIGPTEFGAPTVKRCSPFKDAMTAGYLIGLPVAVKVTATDPSDIHFAWSKNIDDPIVSSHSAEQWAGFGPELDTTAFKFFNPWVVKTPPGVSTLFIPPLNRAPRLFEVFAGVVETDRYANVVNFPFLWSQTPWKGTLEAGTPMVQAIPFRREDFRMSIRDLAGKALEEYFREGKRVSSKLHYYTRSIRVKKNW